MLMLESMRTPAYKVSVNMDIVKEREKNSKLQSRAAQLEKQIKVLIDDSVALLKARMTELGINATSPGDLLAKAKEIVLRHKQLQAKASKLQAQVASMETEQNRLVALRHQELQEKYNGHTNGIMNPHQPLTEDYLLKEISATLSQRKRLHSQVCISLHLLINFNLIAITYRFYILFLFSCFFHIIYMKFKRNKSLLRACTYICICAEQRYISFEFH